MSEKIKTTVKLDGTEAIEIIKKPKKTEAQKIKAKLKTIQGLLNSRPTENRRSELLHKQTQLQKQLKNL